jgi:hypothetical protein
MWLNIRNCYSYGLKPAGGTILEIELVDCIRLEVLR